MIPLALFGFLLLGVDSYPWPKAAQAQRLEERISPPSGFQRSPSDPESFATWLRRLPVRPVGTQVLLHDGRSKADQSVHHSVLDIDVGGRDLQQCADAVIRLRAEYLRASGCTDQMSFDFTSGDAAPWSAWKTGKRPKVADNRVIWHARSSADDSYASFRSYLDSVFTYAGSYSLSRELEAVAEPSEAQPGDVFIQGGFPGHAVMVVDVAENRVSEKIFLLVQSYMPAQDIHVLQAPGSALSPWYPARSSGELRTPEWIFRYRDLKRFPRMECGASLP